MSFKFLLIWGIAVFCGNKIHSQNSPKVFHISTHGVSLKDSLSSAELLHDSINFEGLSIKSRDLIVLSLIDSAGFNNFKSFVNSFKKNVYHSKFILVVVAQKDSKQKLDFIMDFYKNRSLRKSITKSYKLAVKKSKSRNDSLNFKHSLIKLRV